GSRKGAVRGDWVRVKLEEKNGSWSATVRERLGKAGVISSDLDAVMAEYELMPQYNEKEETQALEIQPRDILREDHTGKFVLTIDPFDAKDFDDALSIEPWENEPDFVRLGVHIADVAAFIAPGSKFDEAAKARGFSCYLPGRTLPMLPAGLTARISMQENQRSLAHSVYLKVNLASGEVVSGSRLHTFVTVKKRLDYDEVQDFIDSGKAPGSWSSEVKACVQQLTELTRKMTDFRNRTEKFIDLPLPEIRVLCSENDNRIEGLSAKISRDSEKLVEECMLAANQFVGSSMAAKGIAAIYRTHAEPSEEKSYEFSEMMHESFHLPAGDITNRDVCREFIASLPDDGRKNVILNLLLRAMPRAIYQEKPDLHFALGKYKYCHFTSPIRRYTDLTVHQQLWNADCKCRTRSAKTLEHTALWCTEQEEQIDAACFAAGDRMKLRFLAEETERDPSRIYEAVVVKTIASGIQVEISELGLYGFVRHDRLRGNFRRRKYSSADSRDDTVYKPGNYIYLRLDNIDFARGVANFLPAGR
ncbi:MAG: RNB domain-containing ribonuclease, partial [Lentisphaeria bacterium]|nr:RNB domain-containing ribonuclease [Lentisphaeria bacterium]